jgi:hypothetical protein
MNKLASMVRSFSDRAIRGVAVGADVDRLALALNAAHDGLFLPAVEWSAKRFEHGSAGGLQEKHARAGLAYLVQDADGEVEESNVKARGFETDESPVSVAEPLFLGASLAFPAFRSNSESAIQGAVLRRLSNRSKVVQISVRDFNLGLLLDFICWHHSELDGPDLHGGVVHHRLLGAFLISAVVPRHVVKLEVA